MTQRFVVMVEIALIGHPVPVDLEDIKSELSTGLDNEHGERVYESRVIYVNEVTGEGVSVQFPELPQGRSSGA